MLQRQQDVLYYIAFALFRVKDHVGSLMNRFAYLIYSLTAVGPLVSRQNADSLLLHVFHPVTSLRRKTEVML